MGHSTLWAEIMLYQFPNWTLAQATEKETYVAESFQTIASRSSVCQPFNGPSSYLLNPTLDAMGIVSLAWAVCTVVFSITSANPE